MNDQFAFIDKSKVPTRDEWQAAIDRTGFDFQLNSSFDAFKHSGFLPCTLLGEDAGFELEFVSVDQVFEDPEECAELADGRDFCITMSWGGSMRDCVAVMIASVALAQTFGARISYAGDEPDALEDLLEETASLYSEVKQGEAI